MQIQVRGNNAEFKPLLHITELPKPEFIFDGLSHPTFHISGIIVQRFNGREMYLSHKIFHAKYALILRHENLINRLRKRIKIK